MSFTTDVKKEIVSRGMGGAEGFAIKKAGFSAFLRTSGFVGVKDGLPAFFIVSETERVAEFFTRIFSEIFGFELFITNATMDKMSGRDKLLLQCPAGRAKEVLQTLAFLKPNGDFYKGIAAKLIADEDCKIAYIQGAFLGGGSCTLPSADGKTGYHLEIVFPEKKPAQDFCRLLSEFELLVKQMERKDTFVVYIKSKEMISDFLSLIGAENALRKFSEVVAKRDAANYDNRTRNCMQGNADKAAIAAVKHIQAIEKLKASGTLGQLSEELKALATARVTRPTLSLQELAEYLKISKSCLNHRLRRLTELAEKEEKR